jgi:integrase
MARTPQPWHRAGRGWYSTVKGKQLKLGDFSPDDLKSARDALDRLLAGNAGGSVPPAGVSSQAPEPAPDWRAKVDGWLASRAAKKLKPKTLKDYRWNLDRWLLKFADARPGEITADALEGHSHSFGWGVNQRRHYLRTALMFLAWAGVPVAGKVQCPGHQSAGAAAVISEAAHRAAVAAAPGDVGPMLEFLWHTGARPSEACNLALEFIDWQGGTARLREHKTAASGKTRLLYLCAAALDVLKAQRAKYGDSGPAFRTRTGSAYLRTGLTQTMGRISEKIGQRVTSYGYRHTYATRALELGLPDVQIAALLGHSSTKMIHAHYSHISQNARLLKSVAAQIGGEPPERKAA